MLVAASSAGAYGYEGRSNMVFTEDSPVGEDWWGRGSAAIESEALAARELGMRAVVMRTGATC